MAEQDEKPENQQEDKKAENQEENKNKDERKRPGKKPLIILGIVVIVMIIVALVWWLMTRNQETTDDAFTDGDAVTIAPKVSGYVTDLRVKDNQRVKKGDLLVVIDPRDATAQRDQAKAQLGWPRRSCIRRRRNWRSLKFSIRHNAMKHVRRC